MPPINSEDEDTDLLAGIYQEAITPTLEDRPARSFKPWHKPRKHYIRLKQWCHEIRGLIKRLGYKQGAVLTYLGLPGEDMLDIRALQGVCSDAQITLKYLGFNSDARSASRPYELNLSSHEVYALNFIHPNSIILADYFEKIVLPKSVPLDRIRQFEPFDIVNIDLCDSIASPSKKTQYFDAILKLCDLQAHSRGGKPWLLFLTTRTGRNETSIELKKKLLECVLTNIEADAEFANHLDQNGFPKEDIQSEIEGTSKIADDKLIELFGLAIGKWLLNLMNGHVTVKVKLLQSYRYRVASNMPDMLSLAFELEMLIKPLVDTSGISQLSLGMPAELPSEVDQAKKLAAAIFNLLDVDKLLWDDNELRDKYIAKCSKLMAAAHYDAGQYDVWALEWSSPDKYPAPTQASKL